MYPEPASASDTKRICAVPGGTRTNFPTYPGLPPSAPSWAILFRALRRWCPGLLTPLPRTKVGSHAHAEIVPRHKTFANRSSSNSAIAQPSREIPTTPISILLHGVKRAVRSVIQDGLVGVYERVAHVLWKRSICGCFEVFPFFWISR